MERLTITRTRRWGNSEIQINNVYSAPRSKVKMDQVIRMANDMISREDVFTNEDIEFALDIIPEIRRNFSKPIVAGILGAKL